MLSIYTSAFNIEKMQYDWELAFINFLAIADELVIAVNTSEDNTVDLINDWGAEIAQNRPEMAFQIVFTDFLYDDPDLDGKIKNAALQATSQPYKLGLDLDESINSKFKDQLKNLTSYFLHDKTDCIMLPVINLYKDRERFKDIGQKFYFHRTGLKRGTVNFAKRKDGSHDINKSDSCELLEINGELPRCMYLIHPEANDQDKLNIIKQNNLPFIVHSGLLDLEKKALRNKKFWEKMWNVENGSEDVELPKSVQEIEEKEKLVEGHLHGLQLDDLKLEN